MGAVKKINSGEGATDFGAATGMTQDQLMGRPPLPDSELPSESWRQQVQESAETFTLPRPVNLSQDRIAELIHIELVKDEVSQGKIKSIGFMPSWISRAAEAIVVEYS